MAPKDPKGRCLQERLLLLTVGGSIPGLTPPREGFRYDVMLEGSRGWKPGSDLSKYRVGNDVGHRLLWQMRTAV